MSKSAIPSIHYRGPEDFISVIGSYTRVNYAFSRANDFTVTPETWEDFYEIMLLDKVNIAGRLYVCADDPISKTNLRRVPAEERFVPQNIIDNQQEVDRETERRSHLARFKNEYIGRVNLQIARGEIEEIPETLELDAETYADEQYNLQVVIPADEAAAAALAAETPVVETPIDNAENLSPVADPVIETPVETTPTVETPVVETTEVLENTSAPSTDTVTEPTVEAPTPETPVEETPTVETPVETPTEEPVAETPVEETTTSTRKKSSAK